jgi:hypothetical protein
LGSPSGQQFRTTFELPTSFTDDLRLAIPHFPVNPESGGQQVMFTGFDVQHIWFAENLFCLTISVKFNLTRHLFLAFDPGVLSKIARSRRAESADASCADDHFGHLRAQGRVRREVRDGTDHSVSVAVYEC